MHAHRQHTCFFRQYILIDPLAAYYNSDNPFKHNIIPLKVNTCLVFTETTQLNLELAKTNGRETQTYEKIGYEKLMDGWKNAR